MARNSKNIGLVLILTFVLSAATDSAARAENPAQITMAASPVSLTASTSMLTVRSGRKFECGVASFSSTGIKAGATTMTVTPTYKNCSSSIGLMTVIMNGCDYLLHLEAETKEFQDTWTATTDLVCPAGKSIEWRFYSSAANHAAGKSVCAYKFGGQTGLKTIKLTNEPSVGGKPDWIKADIELIGISSTTEGSVLVCGGASEEWAWFGGAEFTGSSEGVPTGITISTD